MYKSHAESAKFAQRSHPDEFDKSPVIVINKLFSAFVDNCPVVRTKVLDNWTISGKKIKKLAILKLILFYI